jgi:predicted SnoaL-like aldol condensation-catalyzing enzyme
MLAALVALVLLPSCASNGALRALRAQQNTAVVLAFLDTVFNKHEVEQAFRLYVGRSYKQHNPNVADGIDGAVRALTQYTHELHPELRQEVKRTVA